MKKRIKKIGSVLSTLLIVAELVIIAGIVICRIGGNTPSVFGYRMYVIVSPSMEPEISVGDMIISKEYEGQALSVGDVVTYLGREGEMAGKVITHKIVAIEGETIITQGVANREADPAITGDDVLAVMTYKTVVLSAVYRVISTGAGFIILIMLPLIVMIITEIVALMIQIKREGGEDDREERKEHEHESEDNA